MLFCKGQKTVSGMKRERWLRILGRFVMLTQPGGLDFVLVHSLVKQILIDYAGVSNSIINRRGK